MDINKVTVVSASKAPLDYWRGEIGQPLKPHSDVWMMRCPGCGVLAEVDHAKIEQHDESTVSTRAFLRCHGSRSEHRFVIEKNAVRWL